MVVVMVIMAMMVIMDVLFLALGTCNENIGGCHRLPLLMRPYLKLFCFHKFVKKHTKKTKPKYVQKVFFHPIYIKFCPNQTFCQLFSNFQNETGSQRWMNRSPKQKDRSCIGSIHREYDTWVIWHDSVTEANRYCLTQLGGVGVIANHGATDIHAAQMRRWRLVCIFVKWK